MKITATFVLLLLLLLLLVCSISTGSVTKDQQPCLQDIHAVLREMTASLTKQKIEMRLLQRQNEEQAAKLKELNELRLQLQDKQVAFSVALVSSGEVNIGPFPKHSVLIFKHVTTNIGNAYNPHTGIFTAPVRGVYHFVWYVGVHGTSNHPAAAALVKNSEHIFLAWERQTKEYGTGSNGADLQLEAGDVVFVRLWPHTQVYDNANHHVTFTGHLLFTM